MKRFIPLFFLIFATESFAASPCIFGGAYVKCFPASGIKLENGQGLVIDQGAFSDTISFTDTAGVAGLFSSQTHTTVDGSNNAIGLQLSAASSVDTGAYNDKATGAFIATVGRNSGPGGDDNGHLDSMVGAQVLVQLNSGDTSQTDKIYGFSSAAILQHGNVTDNYGLFSIAIPAGDAVITNNYGLYLDYAGPVATNNWGAYIKGNDNWMQKSLQIGGSPGSNDRVANDSVGLGILDKSFYLIPMDETTRDGLTPLEGMLVNNSTSGNLERYDGANWVSVGGGSLTFPILDNSVVASTVDYVTLDIQPDIASLTSSYAGVKIAPTVVGDGSAEADGLKIDMSNVSAVGAGNSKAINVIGDILGNGVLTVAKTFTPVDGGGNPSALHSVGTVFESVADTANVDKFGFSPSMNVHVDDGVALTAGSFGVGTTGLGMLNFFQMDTGSSLDKANGSFVAMATTSGDGALGSLTAYHAIGANLGGTVSVDEMIGFRFDLPTGPFGTDSWGLYDSGAEYNWMKNSLQIGGSAGSTDRVDNTSVGLGVLGKAIYPVPMDTTTRDGLTPLEGMLVNNSTTGDLERFDGAAWTAVGGGGGGGIVIGEPVTGGGVNQVPFENSGNTLASSSNLVFTGTTLGINVPSPNGNYALDAIGSGGPGFGVHTDSLVVETVGPGVDGLFIDLGDATDSAMINLNMDGGNVRILESSGVTSYDLTLPSEQATTPFQPLVNDGSGFLSWGTALAVTDGTNSASLNDVAPGYLLNIIQGDGSTQGANVSIGGGDLIAYTGDVSGTAPVYFGQSTGASGEVFHAFVTDSDAAHLVMENSESNKVRIKVPNTGLTNQTLTLPATTGADGSAMVTDGTGSMAWKKVMHTCNKVTNNCSGTTCAASCSGSGVIAVAGGCRSTNAIIGSYPDLSDWKCETLVSGSIDAYATCCVIP